MNIKKVTQLVLCLFFAAVASAQEVYLETGKTSSTFDYKDSSGAGLDNLQATTQSFMAIGYKRAVFNDKVHADLGATYVGYGAIGSDQAVEGILEWQTNYLEFNLGLDYTLFRFKKASFYAKGGISTGFLINGSQTLSNEVINLKNSDDFNKVMVSFKLGAGIGYPVSNDLSFYAQYLYGKSLDQTNRGDDESLKIKSNSIGFGVLIKLFNANSTSKS
ncbi:outer membrane protein [Mariniflexile sp. AS56]|uniref:outer membrane protein n=1 Tax=Mariniflexile sp. AS56 TaxID=3063957 RepID=UPI0026EC1112|nr:outer membrane beta-barrel protein [Mariniflexile sp. AS56]MDO7174140.1 outer membrane beta-barrel protein [Mariniflexile sp. AS56]